jgi:hypothetical protein
MSSTTTQATISGPTHSPQPTPWPIIRARFIHPSGGRRKIRPLAPRRGPARCSPRPRPRQWACGGGPAMTVLITPARRRRLPSHASDRRRSWSVTPGVRPAVTLAYSARHNGGDGRAAKPASPPPPLTSLPSATPLVTPPHGGPPGPGWRRRACPWMGTTAPPDGEDFDPHPVVLIIGHVADRRGSARKEQRGGEEKEQPPRGVREGAGAAVARGGGGIVMRLPLPSSSRCGDSCGGSTGVSPETTDEEQTTIKS